MMTLTPTAAQAVRALVSNLDMDADRGGLRIAAAESARRGDALELALVNGPEATDESIDSGGAHVFLEPLAAELLNSKQLDAHMEDGRVQFVILEASPLVTPQ